MLPESLKNLDDVMAVVLADARHTSDTSSDPHEDKAEYLLHNGNVALGDQPDA